ncbi:site-specific integrase [Pollutimonas bauzanensis]|uniref:Site-specific recombinase XerC n=1 Tax=Pollutimonas bauzanensis TaxID=658167 RepID=A0A1M5YHX9_9BURK|nr:site-specific integrase [Pollutimonas bauzanensis]SHI11552.1 Site-specific recombinase XerC [Pollutimonas bauzanensis]
MFLHQGLALYEERVSIHKQGYEQERYRIQQLSRSVLAHREIDEITSVDIASYRDARLACVNSATGRMLAPATVRHELVLLSHFFDIARVEFGICSIPNPCLAVRKPKPAPGRDRRLRRGEERLMGRYCTGLQKLELMSIVQLALETAMRQGELLSLRWENISFRTRIAHLPETKNGNKRDVPLSEKAISVLRRIGSKPVGRVFTYTQAGLKSAWRTMLARVRIEDLHFHDLRHEAVSRLFELGTLDIMEVAAITGHRSLSMLKRYTHLRAQKLVAKLDLGRKRAQRLASEYFSPQFGLLTHEGGLWQAYFPDYEPALVVSAETQEELHTRAQSALAMAIIKRMMSGLRSPTTGESLNISENEQIITIEFATT